MSMRKSSPILLLSIILLHPRDLSLRRSRLPRVGALRGEEVLGASAGDNGEPCYFSV